MPLEVGSRLYPYQSDVLSAHQVLRYAEIAGAWGERQHEAFQLT